MVIFDTYFCTIMYNNLYITIATILAGTDNLHRAPPTYPHDL